MTLLNDVEIGLIGPSVISPFDPKMIQPASYELHLGGQSIMVMDEDRDWLTDPSLDITDKGECAKAFNELLIAGDGKFWLQPGGFILVTTQEKVILPNDMSARVEGKSSLGRVGLAIHTTAGWIDPGFAGQITLELSNLSPRTLQLTVGMKIAQLAFFRMVGPALKPYGHSDLGSAYQNQSGVTASKGTRG